MEQRSLSKYLIASPADLLWGATVTSTGSQVVGAGESYPPGGHPSRYLFTPETGRTLDEFQLVYIVSGRGWFTSKTLGTRVFIGKGDALLLFPGEWHSYCPDPETGWEERWIGFDGDIPRMWMDRGLIGVGAPVLRPGMHARLVNLFSQAREYADVQGAGYQKALGGTALEILSLSLYFDRTNDFLESDASALIAKARQEIIADYATITPEEAASRSGISYSSFRKLFKAYCGTSPGQYIIQIKILNAKELLTNTSKQIQEIAWETGFENSDYFTTVFRRVTGITPGEYRKKTTGGLKL